MLPDPKQLACDAALLRSYLDETLSDEQQAAVEEHLDLCHECRARLDQSAAGGDWWNRAERYLRSDAWDGEFAVASSPSCDTRQDGTLADSRAVLQQVEQWLDPSDDPRMCGRFAGYEIVGMVGHGGMGVVLKGFEASLNRYVAIKVLSPTLATSGSARKRFAREAQAAAAVLHNNVVAIHCVDEWRDLPYLVMPYLSDVPLQKRIDDEGPLPLPAILRVGEQIAAGLAAAHAHGLVHRDVKPANILIGGGVERVTLTDFGLARAADDASLTKTGVISGTPHYMSPEQARGEAVDQRSDLFSLGSVLYTMSTGRPPFRAETSYGVLRRITDTDPGPIREINSEIPEWLCTIIFKLMSKQPAGRFASAEEVAELLEACLKHVQQPATGPLPGSLVTQPRSVRLSAISPRLLGVITMFATLGLALCGVVLWNGPGAPESPKGKDRVETRSSQVDETVREILARQEKKADELRVELNVYLRDSKRIYVNGKQISLSTLATVVRKSRTDRAIVTAEPHVPHEKVNEVTELIRKSGQKDIKLSAPKQGTDDRSKVKKTNDKKRRSESRQSGLSAAVLQILARQEKKGAELNVYLRDATRIYVNGTQISLNTLETVVRRSRTDRAIISAEPRVSRERVNEVAEEIRKSGLKDIKLTAPKAAN